MLGSTETYLDTDTKLTRIAWLSASDPHKRFDSLMHHFNEVSLAACFHELDGNKAVGIDEISKADYGSLGTPGAQQNTAEADLESVPR